MAELTAAEAADRIGVSRPTLGNLVRTGQLAARAEPHGSRAYLYVEESEVQRYRAAHPRRQRVTAARDLANRLDQLEQDMASLQMVAGKTGAPAPHAPEAISQSTDVDGAGGGSTDAPPQPSAATRAADSRQAQRAFDDLLAFTSAVLDADRYSDQAEQLAADAAVARQRADSHRREALRIAHALLTDARWHAHLPETRPDG